MRGPRAAGFGYGAVVGHVSSEEEAASSVGEHPHIQAKTLPNKILDPLSNFSVQTRLCLFQLFDAGDTPLLRHFCFIFVQEGRRAVISSVEHISRRTHFFFFVR